MSGRPLTRKSGIRGKDRKDSGGQDDDEGHNKDKDDNQTQEKRSSFKMTDFQCITQPSLPCLSSSDSDSSLTSSRFIFFAM